MRVKAPNQTANFATRLLSLPISSIPFLCHQNPTTRSLQRLLDLGDEQVAVEDAEDRVGQVALLVVDEGGGYHAVPVFSDLTHHLFRVVGVLPDDVELHMMLFDERY